MQTESPLLPGTEVQARGLRWEIVTSQNLGPQTLYRLRGLENAVLGNELDVLFPFEAIEPIAHDWRPDRASPLANWLVYHQAFQLEQALGASALLSVQPGRLRLEPYQLVPVLRAIRMSRVRLLLADGVGLGKTIQAGLVITELVARRLAHRVLIVSPAGPLLQQWELEMAERFGLRLEVIDRAKLDEVRRTQELGANPFDHIPLALASIDFLKQERVLDQLERASYDVVVVDEAHHCIDAGSGQNREDSLRRRLAEVLARRSDALLLTTATPHDGHDRSFASLCELLDPSLVDGRGVLRGESYRAHVIRRLKKHVVDPATKQPLFKDRIVTPVPVEADRTRHEAFVDLQRRLMELVAPELRRAFRNRNYSDVLGWMALLKRSVSTVAACAETLAVVADRFQRFLTDTAELQEVRRQRLRSLKDYHRKLERFGTISSEEEQERSLLEAEDLAQQLASMQREIRRGSYSQTKVSDVVEHLDELIELADQARTADPKLSELASAVQEIRTREPNANILIYTEYVDSQRAAVDALKAIKGLGTILTISGEDDEKTRSSVTERFRSQENLVLVSTDSSAEGLNLHQRCHHLIHLELPFNPNRLEQRNGRIDRYGQTYEPQVKYLFLRGTFEERILLRLIAKYERQRARLTFVPNTLGITTSTDASQARLLKGLMDEDIKLFRDESTLFTFESEEEPISDEATAELLEEIDRSLNGYQQAARTHAWLGDAGLNADERQVEEADQARDTGEKAESVDLAGFVCQAVQLDGGYVRGNSSDEHFVLELPPQWMHGLGDLPGYSSDDRLVRLTTRLDITSDGEGNSVGFLGRAHPLVRRALDRVRNLSFGGAASSGQDPRTSAVKGRVTEPTLLFTFLGRVVSKKGREFERVLAARIGKGGACDYFDSASQWSAIADPANAIRTTDVWETHFTSWAGDAEQSARQAVKEGFLPLAEEFKAERMKTLEKERSQQERWLAQRAEEITGTRGPEATQGILFGNETTSGVAQAPAEWAGIEDPAKRLAGFYSDRSQSAAARLEAEGVLRIYEQRMADLESLTQLAEPEIVPLGLLMIIPE